jgi:hypothetical protein
MIFDGFPFSILWHFLLPILIDGRQNGYKRFAVFLMQKVANMRLFCVIALFCLFPLLFVRCLSRTFPALRFELKAVCYFLFCPLFVARVSRFEFRFEFH